MPTRPPAVAGQFYEGTPERLREQVSACMAANPAPPAKERFIGAVVPHAGLMYSGHVAAAFYIAAELPKRFIILCPNHTGFGHFAAINSEGAWRTPLGDAPVDAALARALMERTELLADDWRAHAREHSLEVQLPFLQHLIGDFSDCIADLLAIRIARRGETKRYKRECAEELLEKRELNFERMLARVRLPVIAQQPCLRHERIRERRVDRNGAERSAPLALAIDRCEVSDAGVVRAEDDEALWQLGRDVERRGHVPAVHQSRVRHHRADEALFRRRHRVGRDASLHLLH